MKCEKIGTYCEVISGYAFKSRDWQDEGVPVIKIANISNGCGIVVDESLQYVDDSFCNILDKKYHIGRGDILISLTGGHIDQSSCMVGRTCRSSTNRVYLLNQRAGKIIPFDTVDRDYLYYLFTTKAIKYDIASRAHGTAQANISPKDIKNIKYAFPSISIQCKIASILSKYDDLIENNNKRIKILEQMAENLYKEWFVRFRFPGHEQSEFENGIPKGWNICKLREIINLRYGKDHKDLEEGTIPVFGSGGVIRYGNRALFSGETVLIPRKGSLQNVMYYKGDLWSVDTMFHSEFKKQHCAAYLYYVLSRYDLTSLNIGTSIPSLSTDVLYNLKVVLPLRDLLVKFEQTLKIINGKKEIFEKQNKNLAQQRDMLLPRLMSGKLKVKV